MSENITPISLTSQARSALRGAAHPLKPVVLIGEQGLTAAVIKEIDGALNAHELIKIRASSQEREDRETILASICQQLGCAAVHHLGKTLIVYRPGKKGLYAAMAGHASPEPVKRKASEPHTPKKLAALGKKATKKRAANSGSGSRKSSRGEPDVVQPSPRTSAKPSLKAFSAQRKTGAGTESPRARVASRTSGKPGSRTASTSSSGARRTTGRSALSLRAGARRRST